jgi:carbamate kinase
LSFLDGKSGRTAIITSLDKTAEAINGSAGTIVKS